jgi:glyoxylase-like metal-dependent hydrolase (beta-lactamase superfamily II)
MDAAHPFFYYMPVFAFMMIYITMKSSATKDTERVQMKKPVCFQIPTPFPVGPVNVYLFKTDPITLIDTGPNTKIARDALRAALEAEGLRPRDIQRVLITHAHSDHSGLAGWLQEEGAQILIHPLEARKLSGLDFLPARREFLRMMGTPAADIDSFNETASVNVNTLLNGFSPLAAGDSLEFDGYCLSVIDTSGHCGGHLSYYHSQSATLFGGDCVLRDISPNPMPELDPQKQRTRSASLAAFLATLDRLEGMEIATVLPGHGAPLANPGARLRQMREHHEERLQKILAELDSPRTPFALAMAAYGRLSGWNILLAVAEICAHLDLLVQRGLINEEIEPLCRTHTYRAVRTA